ncbi:hypothetical protein F4818DRAFT_97598 [Hypoxylon cercidicola]|nr:hypothetical protein F4818DRAFT_97598 [Hypoxylon cercidicola]
MDTKDISSDEKYLALLSQIKQNVERVSRRKGERPRHPPPSFLVTQFMMNRSHTINARRSGMNFTITTTQVPPHYPPCVRPIQELKPMMISRMGLEIHHRGNQVLVHVLTPPDRINAITAIVEDEEGTAVLLQLYNQPDESKVSKENVLQAGDVCIIKEPFFKVSSNSESYNLRVDHVSDIIWLDDTDYRIPLAWRKRILSLDESSQDFRLQGNAAVGKQNWGEAEILYTDAIRTAETPEEKQLAHLNRSLVNLRLGRPEKALDDACRSSANEDPPRDKALFREARALYSLGKFGPSLEKFKTLARFYPENSDAWAEIRRVRQRLYEEETGSYEFASMYEQAEATPPLIDCATYARPVAVRDSPGRGKGLFTTKPVKAGELLLCEKAFAYSYAGDDSPVGRLNTTILMNTNSGTMCVGGQANLITQVVQKIYHNPAESEVFTDMHHGDYVPVTTSKVDGAPVVDTFLVARIIELNCFGAPRSSCKSTMAVLNDERKCEPDAHSTCGIWPLASRINHSCVTNCRRSFIGDMMIVRATEDMKAGTELRFQYQLPDPNETFEETQKKLKGWGFRCDCAMCLDKKRTPPSTLRERHSLYESRKPGLRPGGPMAQITRAAKVAENLEKTYAGRQDTSPPLPRLELWDTYLSLGGALCEKGRLAEGLEMLIKALEALGFVVVACPPRDTGSSSKKKKKKTTTTTMLEIKHWGSVNDYVVDLLSEIFQVYSRLAPELCETVKEYAGVAYSICVGEKETIGRRYPEFA